MLYRSFLLLVVVSLATSLRAQSPPAARMESQADPHYVVYAGYSWLSNAINGIPGEQHSLTGLQGSIAFRSWHRLRFKVDAARYHGTNDGAQEDLFYIMGGGEYDLHLGHELFFAEGLFGDAGADRAWGPNGLPGNTASAAADAGGGIDTPLSRHFAFRVQADYQYTYFALIHTPSNVPYRIPGLPTNFARLSTGLAFKF